MTAIARLRGVERIFASGLKALGPLDLDIAAGDFVTLVGPSGCGKSTALRILAELLAPTAGTLAFPHGKPRIGFVFQDATLMPWTDVRANVRLPLDLQRVPRNEADARAGAALARIGLAGFSHAFPRALSGGMRMRVSIARALVSRPQLLLMDEPFAALDEIGRETLNQDLLKLWREDDLTIVFVTHSVYEAAFLSTRVVTMTPRPGRITHELRLSSPPDRAAEWRTSREFIDAAHEISRALRSAMADAA